MRLYPQAPPTLGQLHNTEQRRSMSYLYFPSDRSSPHIPSTTPLPSPCHSFCHLVFSANQQLSPPLSLMLCICNVLFSLPPHLVGTNLLQQWFIPSFTFSTTVFYFDNDNMLLNQIFYSLPAWALH